MTTDLGRVAEATGLSQVEPQSSQGLDPTGFDPSRWHPEQRSFAKQIADEIAHDSGGFGLGGAAIHAGAMMAAGRIWLRENPAIAMEARQGGDSETRPHPKDDSAGRQASPMNSPMTNPDEVTLVEKVARAIAADQKKREYGPGWDRLTKFGRAHLKLDAKAAIAATPLVKMREALEFIGGHDAAANGLSGFAFELVEQLTGAARAALSSNLEGG
jgi:hypothetical protein